MKSEMPCIRVLDQRSQLFWGTSALWLASSWCNIFRATLFSTFSGTVFDPLNGYLPGVTMTLTNTQSGAKHEIRSDRSGHFEFVGLPPGSYSLQAVLPGFSLLTGTLDLTGGGQITDQEGVLSGQDSRIMGNVNIGIAF